MVVEEDFHLVGVITDADLRKHIKDKVTMKYAGDIMNINPTKISSTQLAIEALVIMNNKSIISIPVVKNEIVVGIVHIHDLLQTGARG